MAQSDDSSSGVDDMSPFLKQSSACCGRVDVPLMGGMQIERGSVESSRLFVSFCFGLVVHVSIIASLDPLRAMKTALCITMRVFAATLMQ